jgi:hypothetical protein
MAVPTWRQVSQHSTPCTCDFRHCGSGGGSAGGSGSGDDDSIGEWIVPSIPNVPCSRHDPGWTICFIRRTELDQRLFILVKTNEKTTTYSNAEHGMELE